MRRASLSVNVSTCLPRLTRAAFTTVKSDPKVSSNSTLHVSNIVKRRGFNENYNSITIFPDGTIRLQRSRRVSVRPDSKYCWAMALNRCTYKTRTAKKISQAFICVCGEFVCVGSSATESCVLLWNWILEGRHLDVSLSDPSTTKYWQ